MKTFHFALALAFAAVSPVRAAVFHVNTGTDKTLGSQDECPLRAALKNIANLNEDGLPFGVHNAKCPAGEAKNTIYFDFAPEAGGNPVVKVDPVLGALALNANHVELVGVTLDGQGKTAVLELYGTASMRLHHATVRNGHEYPGGSGAGILAQGDSSLFLEQVRVVGNFGGGEGAGVAFDSTGLLQIGTSYFGNNRAMTGTGGALAIKTTTRQVMIWDSTFESNEASVGGGAIYCSNAATPFNLEGSSIRSNRATYAFATGGALLTNCRTKVRFTGFANNRVPDGMGGAIYNSASLVVEDSSFVGNEAKDKFGSLGIGGAILDNGDLSVTRSGFHKNVAARAGGAIAIDEPAANRKISLANSTFAENESKDTVGVLNPGAAIWIADVAFQPGDQNGMRMQNLTLYRNLGYSQLYLDDKDGLDTQSIVLANSLLIGRPFDEGSVDVCGGRIERLRISSNGVVANTQFPGTTCDQPTAKMPMFDPQLAGAKSGGFFDQVYVPQGGMSLPMGDFAQCNGDFVFKLDQFANARQCRQGAVEGGPTAERKHAEMPN